MTEHTSTKKSHRLAFLVPAPLRAVDLWLDQRGFSPIPKKTLYRTLLTGILATLGSIGPWQHAEYLRWFGLFALFSAWNFFGLVNFCSAIISDGWNKISALKTFFRFQMRLFLTAIVVYAALVWWNVSVVTLVAGLSVALVWALVGALASGTDHQP